ncbi:MAG TPA: flavin reductase family protein [Alphaproteobacteria bacterium]
MRHDYIKRDFSVYKARQLLEPGPIVLVSSAYKDKRNIMTLGWYTVMEFTPSLIGCIIANSNHSFDLIRKSRECAINIPTADMVNAVVKIGNSDGANTDKFEVFDLTAQKAKKISVPLIKECYANFECKLEDTRLINKYNFFIFKIVKAIKATSPVYPQTLHYHGQGIFTTDGRKMDKSKLFTKWKNSPTF